jgi:energy-coupling factor transporter ATP-binding protein EcfA2
VYVRFFRSFNFDYLRQAHKEYKPAPWDTLDDGRAYPFVQIPLTPDVTTVVGANESGKSQLLDAIKYALSGQGAKPSDFCRYSEVFSISRQLPSPDFGLELGALTQAERASVGAAIGVSLEADDQVRLFRFSGRPVEAFITGGETVRYTPANPDLLNSLLPRWYEIDSKTALPNRVPVARLTQFSDQGGAPSGAAVAISAFVEQNPQVFTSVANIQGNAEALFQTFSTAPLDGSSNVSQAQVKLVRDLILQIGDVSESTFQQILDSVIAGDDGYVNGLVERVNRNLATGLNFPHWWSQDHKFQLLVSVRGSDLVLTIKDRTGTEYSFAERSGGMKYFLSYFVQYLSHRPAPGSHGEILLMDEPDAFLSSQGQQDLLRIFEDVAHPANPEREGAQVVYVTHSPFLIDKNHGERIRVLEKGEADEGTRVVRNAARNHYEPLRSAFGAFVAETTFIGQCNLMLEGMSDQIILAAVSAWMTRTHPELSAENLDLNTITLVPAGSASQIPYLVYLAVGRDVDRPAVITLVDSDESGDKAVATLAKGGPYNKPLLKRDYVLQLAALNGEAPTPNRPEGYREIEDMLPASIVLHAARNYVAEFLGSAAAKKIQSLTIASVDFDGSGTQRVVEAALQNKLGADFHLDKVGLARHVGELLRNGEVSDGERDHLLAVAKVLMGKLVRMQRAANLEISSERVARKVKRAVKAFQATALGTPTRDQALVLVEAIERDLPAGGQAEPLRDELRRLRNDFHLDEDPSEPLDNSTAFIERVHASAYLREIESQDADFAEMVEAG